MPFCWTRTMKPGRDLRRVGGRTREEGQEASKKRLDSGWDGLGGARERRRVQTEARKGAAPSLPAPRPCPQEASLLIKAPWAGLGKAACHVDG